MRQSKDPSVRRFTGRTGRPAAALMSWITATCWSFVHLAATDNEVLRGTFRDGLPVRERFPHARLFQDEAVVAGGSSGARRGCRPAVRPLSGPGLFDAQRVADLFRRAYFVLLTGRVLICPAVVLSHGGLGEPAGSPADSLLTRRVAFADDFRYLLDPVAFWCSFTAAYSSSFALDRLRATKAFADILARLAEGPRFPIWYAPLSAHRSRFATAKLTALRLRLDREALKATRRADAGGQAGTGAARAGCDVRLALALADGSAHTLLLSSSAARCAGDVGLVETSRSFPSRK